MTKKNQKVPVIMYHSVGVPNKKWHLNYLTCPYRIFENHLKWLQKNNFRTIYLNDLYDYIFNNKEIPGRSIVLTFDDGYVDNWIYAYPLLKKYNMKGTIFVNPEFVDPRDIKRDRFDEVDDLKQLETNGFLSWQEMTGMEKSGVIDIQSHAMTHTHYPISDKIIDFRHPGDDYIHLTWNNNIKKKPFLQIDNKELIDYGEPVYEMSTSLNNYIYYPDNNLKKYMIKFVSYNGGDDFFKKNDWLDTLNNELEKFKANNKLSGRYESKKEHEKRIYDELYQSKKILEDKLDKTIGYLCWPEGSGSKLAVELARQIGYKMTTAAKDIPKKRKSIPNSPNLILDRINRFSFVLSWNGIEGYKAKIKYMKGWHIALRLSQFRKNIVVKYCFALILKIIRELSL